MEANEGMIWYPIWHKGYSENPVEFIHLAATLARLRFSSLTKLAFRTTMAARWIRPMHWISSRTENLCILPHSHRRPIFCFFNSSPRLNVIEHGAAMFEFDLTMHRNTLLHLWARSDSYKSNPKKVQVFFMRLGATSVADLAYIFYFKQAFFLSCWATTSRLTLWNTAVMFSLLEWKCSCKGQQVNRFVAV